MRDVEEGSGNLSVVLAVVLIVGALGAVPFVLMGRMQARQVDAAAQGVTLAREVQAQADLQRAVRTAQFYLAERDTFQGYGADTAAAYDPGLVFNESARAVPGEVSVRGVTATTLVLVTATADGTVLCAGADLETVSHGRVDAARASDCTGGW